MTALMACYLHLGNPTIVMTAFAAAGKTCLAAEVVEVEKGRKTAGLTVD